ncbi:unnamed protein product [Citrullus colocynthis]|uniref:Uncharacterized protein n=1 Tax=Citrullus colocynthis TaxID=252529 RepID=A0ABP0YWK5_9ROSI
METPWARSVGVCLLATFFLFFFLCYCGRRHNLNQPPGPKPLPFIGNLHLIGPLPRQSIHQLSKKYGPIMQLWFGSFPVVVGSSVEMAKLFLKTHDLTFVYRPENAVGNPKRLDSHHYIRKQEINAFLQEIYKASSQGSRIELKCYLFSFTMNVISRMALGKNYLLLDQSKDSIVSPDEFKDMIDELFLLSGVVNIGDWIPWIDFLDLQGYVKRMKALSKKLDALLEHINIMRGGRELRIMWLMIWWMFCCNWLMILILKSNVKEMESRRLLW